MVALSNDRLAKSTTVTSDTFRFGESGRVSTAVNGAHWRTAARRYHHRAARRHSLSIPFERVAMWDACGNGVAIVHEKPWWRFW